MIKRKVEIAVVSDVHLGTFGCHAKELLNYLRSIEPEILILNGDIVDIWQFNKWYWPNSHMKVVKQLLGMASKNTKVYYLTGNHDELLRKFSNIKIGQLEILNNLELVVDGEKCWFFHGDVLDIIMKNNKWLAKVGAVGYDSLILFNRFVNSIAKLFGQKRVSLSKQIKNNVKNAVKHINNFEETAANMAITKGYDYLFCGHIHQPEFKEIINENGKGIFYLNSGDWIENLTSLEYNEGSWSVYKYNEDLTMKTEKDDKEIELAGMKNKVVFDLMLNELIA